MSTMAQQAGSDKGIEVSSVPLLYAHLDYGVVDFHDEEFFAEIHLLIEVIAACVVNDKKTLVILGMMNG